MSKWLVVIEYSYDEKHWVWCDKEYYTDIQLMLNYVYKMTRFQPFSASHIAKIYYIGE